MNQRTHIAFFMNCFYMFCNICQSGLYLVTACDPFTWSHVESIFNPRERTLFFVLLFIRA